LAPEKILEKTTLKYGESGQFWSRHFFISFLLDSAHQTPYIRNRNNSHFLEIGCLMKIPSYATAGQIPSLSILKSANKQPELAGELISKTVEGLVSGQTGGTMVDSVATASPPASVSGNIINTVA